LNSKDFIGKTATGLSGPASALGPGDQRQLEKLAGKESENFTQIIAARYSRHPIKGGAAYMEAGGNAFGAFALGC